MSDSDVYTQAKYLEAETHKRVFGYYVKSKASLRLMKATVMPNITPNLEGCKSRTDFLCRCVHAI